MSRTSVAERVWWGDTPVDRAMRAALVPLGALYGAVMVTRNALYDVGVLRSHEPALPAISVGNLSVGGTGKTPVAAWLAGELARRGAGPAIVLRGYGDDEPLVHRHLNPTVPVIVNSDRLAGIDRAAEEGADVAVLDDAFQHRRVRRVVDIVLVSADRWQCRRWRFPAGPWREGLHALRRATLVIVVRKAVEREACDGIIATLSRDVPGVPIASAHLAMEHAHRIDRTAATPIDDLVGGSPVLAISAVGDWRSFDRQLERHGARIETHHFADHHCFTPAEVGALAASVGGRIAVCTLKDAVKLAPMWPPAPPLWYVSQSVVVERGEDAIDSALETALQARHVHPLPPPGHSARRRTQ